MWSALQPPAGVYVRTAWSHISVWLQVMPSPKLSRKGNAALGNVPTNVRLFLVEIVIVVVRLTELTQSARDAQGDWKIVRLKQCKNGAVCLSHNVAVSLSTKECFGGEWSNYDFEE